MRKYIYNLIILLVCFYGVSQETPNYQLQNYAPKTPEAAAFLKYGEYPVDLSSGVPNISIPLYSIESGGFSLPITLDYHASGIKVSQEATWVGLGWNLNFGAQVILSVRDDVDENNPYIDSIPDDEFISAYWDQHPYQFIGGILTSENLDKSRVKDFYSFSSPTANGSFYIRNFSSNDVVVVPPDSSFKVELLGSSRANMGFKITDNQGNEYLFNSTKEISARTMTHNDTYISAWYVDKIKTTNNDEINFVYQDDGNQNDYSQSQRIEITEKRVTKGEDDCPDFTLQHQISPVITEGGTTITISKKIKEILFNDGNSKVVFDKTNGRLDMGDSNNGFLNKIEVKQLENNLFITKKGYTFEYSYFSSSNSPNLPLFKCKRLKLDGVYTIIEGEGHQFVYSDLGLPNKTSKSQDYFGYYNGENNQNLIPKHFIYNPDFYPPIIEEVGGANRNVNPNVNQGCILKEIHYPTKGWTKFNYQTNEYRGIDEFEQYNLQIINSNTLEGTGSAGQHPSNFESPGIDLIPICNLPNSNNCVQYREVPFQANNTLANLSFYIFNDGSIPAAEMHHRYARVRVYSNGQEVYNSTKLEANNPNGNGSYSLEIDVPIPNLTTGSILMEVYGDNLAIEGLELRYFNISTPILKNLYGGGLRVSSIENYNHDNTLILKKEFDYRVNNNTTESSGKLINSLSTTFKSSPVTNYNFGFCSYNSVGGGASKLDSQKTFNISSNSKYGIEGNNVVYSTVFEKSIDFINNSNSGFTKYEFTTDSDDIPFVDPTIQIYTTWKRGKLLGKKVYDGNNKLLSEQTNSYFEDTSKLSFVKGFKMFRHGNVNVNEDSSSPLSIPPIMLANPFMVDTVYEIVEYNLSFPWFYQKTSTNTEYFYNSSGNLNGQISKTTTFNYNNPIHQQLSSQTSITSNGETVESKYFYPQDPEMNGEPCTNDLITKNRIAEQLLVQQFNNNVKLSEHKTLYKKWSDDIISPEIIKSSKGSNSLENRIRFNLVDTENGNPLELQQENGTVVSYIWGYNKSLPIAKIENASNTQIALALGLSNLATLSEVNIVEINNLRTLLPNAMVTTYTYIPLIGVNSITDPKGNSITYEYDSEGRLRTVKDKDGYKLTENEYHYKN